MRQRVSVITLGVADVDRARRFYDALGWTTGAQPGAGIAFFQAGGMIVALSDRAKLAHHPHWTITEDGGTVLGS